MVLTDEVLQLTTEVWELTVEMLRCRQECES